MGANIIMERCQPDERNQLWRYTEIGELRPMGSSKLCLDSLKVRNNNPFWSTTVVAIFS